MFFKQVFIVFFNLSFLNKNINWLNSQFQYIKYFRNTYKSISLDFFYFFRKKSINQVVRKIGFEFFFFKRKNKINRQNRRNNNIYFTKINRK